MQMTPAHIEFRESIKTNNMDELKMYLAILEAELDDRLFRDKKQSPVFDKNKLK